MVAALVSSFDYGTLTAEIVADARSAAERIRLRMSRAAEDIIEIGRDLIAQKKALGHGNFLPWIEAEFGMSEDSAQNFMRVSKEFGANTERVRNLSPKALYLLAAPSMPETVREEATRRSEKGEKITPKDIDALKKKLASAKERAESAEGKLSAQESRADIASKQRKDALTEAMFLRADVERLTKELEQERADKTIRAVIEPSNPVEKSVAERIYEVEAEDDSGEMEVAIDAVLLWPSHWRAELKRRL